MLHADRSLPTKVHRLQTKMRREVLPRAPQVSVVTQTIYASSTSTSTGMSLPVQDQPIPFGTIAGGTVSGMIIVLLAVGGWWWWGSRLRSAKKNGAKSRRAQQLTDARATHGKTESTETLKTNASHSNSQSHSSHVSEKSANQPPVTAVTDAPASEPVKKPSAILAQQKHSRSPFMHQMNSSASLGGTKYAPLRPSPLATNVVTRSPSVMSENPPTVVVSAPAKPGSSTVGSPQPGAPNSLAPATPSVKVVPPSPPRPARTLAAPGVEPNQRQSLQSVQTVASEYSVESLSGWRMAEMKPRTRHT